LCRAGAAYLTLSACLSTLCPNLGMDLLAQGLLQRHQLALGVLVLQHHLVAAGSSQQQDVSRPPQTSTLPCTLLTTSDISQSPLNTYVLLTVSQHLTCIFTRIACGQCLAQHYWMLHNKQTRVCNAPICLAEIYP